MPKTIDRLRSDHQRLWAVLETLSRECDGLSVEHFHGKSDHLFCLVDYLLGYPDKVHHPTEDRVFDELARHDVPQAELDKVTRNRAQHETLETATAELRDLVDSEPSSESELRLFLDRLAEYVTLQQQHMQFEEAEVFPIGLQYIPPEDWDRLDEAFGESKDPLFDEADRRYAALYEFLVPSERHEAEMAEPLLRFLSNTVVAR